MVDPPEGGVANEKSLLERLCEAPRNITEYLADTIKTYVGHTLGLVKSYWPKADLSPLADGMAADCSEEKFSEDVEDLKPVAQKLVDSFNEE